MANVKITELTALTTPAGTDVLPIVDVVSDVTKKITVSDLNAAVGGYADPLTTDGDIVIRSGGVTTRLGIGSTDQVLKVSGGLPVWAAEDSSDVVLDTTPQLGGNLDVNGNYIVSASGGDVEIAPDTTGSFVIRGNNTDGSITLNCTANTHGVTIQSPPHASAATYTLILPDDTGTSGQVLSTNGTGTLSWLTATQPGDNVSTLTNDSGFITSTVTGDFTVDTDTLYVDSTNNRVGIVEATPAVALDVTGEIRASTGILFGTDTAADNTLDDYEEGTWNPTVAGSTTAGTATYSAQDGSYEKIGRQVTVRGYVSWTSATGTGSLQIGGLPFASISTSLDYIQTGSVMLNGITFPTGYTMATAYLANGVSELNIFFSGTNVGWIAEDIEASGSIIISITYPTDA